MFYSLQPGDVLVLFMKVRNPNDLPLAEQSCLSKTRVNRQMEMSRLQDSSRNECSPQYGVLETNPCVRSQSFCHQWSGRHLGTSRKMWRKTTYIQSLQKLSDCGTVLDVEYVLSEPPFLSCTCIRSVGQLAMS
ncbi:hypothetical protein FGIG_05308 [Fasciola gigantica]|uniref:Uncharacterized protein n=1 Tax=Fasciola gigantica TaxID=46835 RepID=A0A504YRH5_FASGI|nr:hypothetical protein FGIG_05308 [Fasciola gigantica]